MSARAEDAARALSREQPTTADAAVPAPANNGSADAEGVEIPAPEPSGNKNLLSIASDAAAAAGNEPDAASEEGLPAGSYISGICLVISFSPCYLTAVRTFA